MILRKITGKINHIGKIDEINSSSLELGSCNPYEINENSFNSFVDSVEYVSDYLYHDVEIVVNIKGKKCYFSISAFYYDRLLAPGGDVEVIYNRITKSIHIRGAIPFE